MDATARIAVSHGVHFDNPWTVQPEVVDPRAIRAERTFENIASDTQVSNWVQEWIDATDIGANFEIVIRFSNGEQFVGSAWFIEGNEQHMHGEHMLINGLPDSDIDCSA